MRKKNFLMLLGLAGLGLTAQAQVIATLGFEDGDQFYHHKDSAQFADFYGDHINLQPGDVWNEKCEEAYSGTYALEANNSNTVQGSQWFRGLKLRYLPIEEGKSYRVSFWVKANKTFTMADGGDPINTAIKSSLSIGHENLEAPLMSQSGTQYYYDWKDGIMTGDWRRLSFVAYNSGKAVQDKFFDQFDDNIKDIIVNDPNDPSKNDTIWWKGDDTSFPNTYFLTINMYNPGRYLLDDIKIEEATMAGCTYNYDAIRVDFGYPTNAAQLASASTDPIGVHLLSNSYVKVMNGDQEMEVASVELKQDGYMYIFMANEIDEDERANIHVSFTPDAECPLIYTTDQRPSMDVESEMKVLPFTSEAIYYDETIEEMSYLMDGPNFLSSVPEDHSFELDPATFNEVQVNYDRAVSTVIASVLLMQNGVQVADLYSSTVVSEDDPNTLVVSVGTLENGEYQLVVSNVTNAVSGFEALQSQTINFSVGPDLNPGTSEVIYSAAKDFATYANGTFPKGWLSNDNGTIHQYGVTETGEVWNYNWGGNIGGGGCRLQGPYTGDFNGMGLYWRATGGTVGTATYGEQVKDYVMPDGTLDPEMDPGVALHLTPRKYQVSFRMAAWKGFADGTFPKYDFSLEKIDLNNPDAEGEVVARFNGVEAKPSVEGAQNVPVTGTALSTTEFTVAEEGYYMLKFSCLSEGGYHEFLLGAVELVSKPSDAAYYKALLATAIDSATVVAAAVENEIYNGTTKTALSEALEAAKNGTFNSPSAIEEMNAKLYDLCGKMLARQANVDSYDVDMQTLRDNMAKIDPASKYVMADEYIEGENLLKEYDGVSSLDLEDEALSEAIEKLEDIAAKVGNIQSCVDALTYRLTKFATTAERLGAEPASLITDAQNALDDDDDLAASLAYHSRQTLYKILGETGKIADEMKDTLYSETETDETTATGYKVLASGVDLTGFVKNPNFYSYITVDGDSVDSENTPGWDVVEGKVTVTVDGSWNATEDKAVADNRLHGLKMEYKICQTLTGLPVGIYDVLFDTRTFKNANAYFNAVNDETGVPDKYIWAVTSDAPNDTIRVMFVGGDIQYDGKWGGFPTVIPDITVKEGTELTIGIAEKYVSGKNFCLKDESGNWYDAGPEAGDQGNWDTQTMADDARLFFKAPLEGYDYAKAYADNIDDVKVAEAVSYEYYTVDGMKLERPMKGVNLVKIHRADGTTDVKKVIVK